MLFRKLLYHYDMFYVVVFSELYLFVKLTKIKHWVCISFMNKFDIDLLFHRDNNVSVSLSIKRWSLQLCRVLVTL